MAVNKVIYGDNTLIDLTNDTVSPEKLLLGETAHDKSGAAITGTYQGGGGIEFDLLWTNPNPSSAFSPQYIYGDWKEKYNTFLVCGKNTTSDSKIGPGVFMRLNSDRCIQIGFGSTSVNAVYMRRVQMTWQSFRFYACFVNGTGDNTKAIPTHIYGCNLKYNSDGSLDLS